ncbi:hypothetical protein [Streptococcus pneumoniae]|uniref:hypothetical protein n=1 Tax=Streptococcus pneumoniae TaxID=1313 RepID=UPI001CB76EF8|nr:hypothetical protein [Streptococcus pneumoniae]
MKNNFLPIAVKYLIVHYGLGCIAGLLVHFFLPTSDDMIKTTLLITWLLPVGVAIMANIHLPKASIDFFYHYF